MPPRRILKNLLYILFFKVSTILATANLSKSLTVSENPNPRKLQDENVNIFLRLKNFIKFF